MPDWSLKPFERSGSSSNPAALERRLWSLACCQHYENDHDAIDYIDSSLKIELIALIASFSSLPVARISTRVSMLALSIMIAKMLRASAVRSLTFNCMDDLKDFASFTSLAAGLKCNPFSH